MKTLLSKMTKRMTDMTAADQCQTRRLPMPESRTQKRFSMRRQMLGLLALLALGVLLFVPEKAQAVEAVTNGVLNGAGTWTFDVAGGTATAKTNAYDSTTTRTAGSGSAKAAVTGTEKGKTVIGTFRQPITIPSGSTINTVSLQYTLDVNRNIGDSIVVSLTYNDNSSVTILTSGELTSTTWAQLTATPGTVLAQAVKEIVVTMTAVTQGGNPGSTVSLWTDEISVDYSVPLPCTTANPTINLSPAGQSIGAAATAAYAISLTNNDSGGGCGGTTFTVVVPAGGDTGNTASFVTPSVTNPATCTLTLGEGVTDNTSCTLRVTSTAAPTNGHVMNTVVRVTSGVHTAQTANVNTTISLAGAGLACADCHGDPPTDGARSAATGAFVGNHGIHVTTQSYTCDICHVASGGYTAAHRNKNIEIKIGATAVQGGYYDKNKSGTYTSPADTTWAQTPTVTVGNCVTTWCHGTNSDDWGTSPGGNTCVKCHGVKGTASPTDAQIAPGGTGTDTAGHTVATDAQVGAHQAHLTAPSIYSAAIACSECHVKPATANAAGHIDNALPAEMTWGTLAKTGTLSPSFAGSGGACTNVYCHGAKMPSGSTDGSDKAPTWIGTAYLSNTKNYNTDCAKCHGFPPKGYSGSHESMTTGDGADCEQCHPHLNDAVGATETGWSTSGVFNDVTKHINGTVEATGCTGCHGTNPKEYPPLSKWGADRTTAVGVGAHVAHIEATATLMTKELITGEADLTGYWCAECHTTTRGAGGHGDGYPAEVSFANAVESKYRTTTAAFTPESGADIGPDLGLGGTCTVYCHGANMPNGDTLGSDRTPAWGQTLTGCGVCHGFPPTPTGTHSGVTLGTQCGGCHTATMTNGNAAITNTANHINGTLEVTTSCTGCHNGSGTGARKVGPSSSHTDPDGTGGTYAAGGNHCAVCHFTGTDHTNEATGTVAVVWDARTMGTAYDGTTNGSYRIHLKNNIGGGAAKSYEAQICWGCHWDIDVPSLPAAIKEFGPTQGAYTTGSLTATPTSTGNWFGATWTSANFAYKTGPINSFHQVISSTAVNPAIDTAHTAADVATIGCTSCHDVHSVGNNGFTPAAGTSYVRGSWTSNPFKEDGAPQLGQVVSSNRGAVPRGIDGTASNTLGGWQIEQNNLTFANTTYGGASGFAGICANCHTQAGLEAMTWTGHDGAVSGFTGNTNNDIFQDTKRGGTNSWARGNMSYNQITTYRASGTYVGGLRNARADGKATNWTAADGIAPQDIDSLQTNTPISYPFGSVTTITSPTGYDNNFHNFPCSKCHSPHASRLPRLMITNCLDVKHNTWGNDQGIPDNWTAKGTDGVLNTHLAKKLPYSSTAQNCHRYVSSTDTNKEQGSTGENGWNSVTPW